MKLKCLFQGHDWIVGRVADDAARSLVRGKKTYHNRACCRCGKDEWHADAVEAEAERLRQVRQILGEKRNNTRP